MLDTAAGICIPWRRDTPGLLWRCDTAASGVVKIIERNEPFEQEFMELLQSLHTDIQHNKKDHFFYLPGTSVLANNWFYRFTDAMREKEVDMMGFEGLKNLRVNVHKPETLIQVSSGIDWFDASVELKFGDQTVSIVDVKNALARSRTS